MCPSVPLLEEDEFEPLPPELQSEVTAHFNDERSDCPTSSSGRTHDTLDPALEASSTHPGSYLHSNSMDGDVPTYAEDAIRHRPLVLPPPPQKVPLAGPAFYEYPNEFEDDVVNVGPSLPPFDDEPSAPPFEFEDRDAEELHMIGPSAPPLEFTEGSCLTLDVPTASAPGLDALDGEGDHHGVSLSDGAAVEASAPPLPSPPDDRPGDSPGAPGAVEAGEGARRGRVSPPRYLP